MHIVLYMNIKMINTYKYSYLQHLPKILLLELCRIRIIFSSILTVWLFYYHNIQIEDHKRDVFHPQCPLILSHFLGQSSP